MISLSGYGATGPESEYVSYGPAQVPLSGFSSLTGYPEWRPMHVGISYGAIRENCSVCGDQRHMGG